MGAGAVEHRIFVVGVPRSGTTLVQSLLAAHGAVTSFPESHLFSRHFTLVPVLGTPVLTRDPGPRLEAFLAECGESAAPPRARRPTPRPLLPFRTRAAARDLLRALDHVALGRETARWVEKTPRHLRYAPFLQRLSRGGPRTSVVHVVRLGLEVVASLHEASRLWERPYGLDACVRRWNADVAYSLRWLGKPGHHGVLYEALATDPEPVLRALLSALDLDWEPAILQRYAEASAELVTPAEEWKAGVGRPIRPAATAEQVLTSAQRERVAARLRGGLYERARALCVSPERART